MKKDKYKMIYKEKNETKNLLKKNLYNLKIYINREIYNKKTLKNKK